MSKRAQGAIPKTGSKPSASSMAKPGDGKRKSQKGKAADAKAAKKDVVEWQLPAFSVPPKEGDKKKINWEKLRKDNARRQAPEGEDIKEIRKILKEVKGKDVPVHEFMNMVSPYTGDNGATLRSIMGEDLEAFRKLAVKVYETMTQDVSDVLVNEQLQMVQYYEEKNGILNDKMMRAINEVYEMAPDFNFEQFLKDKDEYLQMLFPMPRESNISDEACEILKRQQAYHRLQWLRSEGERMSDENKRLTRRLEELKREQRNEQKRAAELAAKAEAKMGDLTHEETEMKEQLEKLNESIEKSFIRTEMKATKEHNRTVMEVPSETAMPTSTAAAGPSASTGAVRKIRSGAAVKKTRTKKTDWSTSTAAEMEEDALKEAIAMEAAKKKASRVKRPKRAKTPPPPEEAFHYSPVKTPPPPEEEWTHETAMSKAKRHLTQPGDTRARTPPPKEITAFGKKKKEKTPPKQTSPFHYSPPKSPSPDEWVHQTPAERARQHMAKPQTPGQQEEFPYRAFGLQKPPKPPKQTSPFHYSPPKTPTPFTQETRIEETTTTIQQPRPQPRQSRAPRESWGGFY